MTQLKNQQLQETPVTVQRPKIHKNIFDIAQVFLSDLVNQLVADFSYILTLPLSIFSTTRYRLC